jgi:hypothetical protein
VSSKRAQIIAGRMGARAGEAFATTGRPTPNPFGRVADLGAAWRRAYFAALRRARRRP